MLDSIYANVITRAITLPLEPAISIIEAFFDNRLAFNYAKESLRTRYEEEVYPASYEHVVQNLRVPRQDLLDYFRSTNTPSAVQLEEFLKERLASRAADWTTNRPPETLFKQMINDFYDAYQRYFFTTDPTLATLHLSGLTRDANEVLVEIRDVVFQISESIHDNEHSLEPLIEDITIILKIAGLPFDLIEECEKYVDITVADCHGRFPTTTYLRVARKRMSEDSIDALEDVRKRSFRFSRWYLITNEQVTEKHRKYANNRGLEIVNSRELRKIVSDQRGSDTFVIGSTGASSLLEAYNIDKLYIAPDVVRSARPGDEMEYNYFTSRENSDSVIDEFLKDAEADVFVLLGDYGSGKTAVACHTLNRYVRPKNGFVAAFVPLGRQNSADSLVELTERCDRTLRALFPGASKTIIILDGLDELPNAMSPGGKKQNLLRILEAAAYASKILVTARTSYFRGLEDFWELFGRADEEALWARLARHLVTTAERRPNVQAAILREFDTKKIYEYVSMWSSASQKEPQFADNFFEELTRNDPDGVYVRFMRTPLYLFLILSTEPWRDETVVCFADVIRLFIKYWLERDVAKGPSRWLLTTDDRRGFIDAIAWWMFKKDVGTVTYDQFDAFVKDYFGLQGESEELRILGLDLQTTGIFSAVGDNLFFTLPAYGNYFVASHFHLGFGADWPLRLPDVNQAKLWLGLTVPESSGCSPRFDFSDPPDGWAEKVGVDFNNAGHIKFDITGIVYSKKYVKQGWSVINSSNWSRPRAVLRASLEQGSGAERYPGIRVSLNIVNTLGLHARASAKLVAAVSSVPTRVLAVCRGRSVNAKSIMGIMMLCASKGSIVDLVFFDATQKQIDEVRTRINGKPVEKNLLDSLSWHKGKGTGDIWNVDFGEHYYGQGRVGYD